MGSFSPSHWHLNLSFLNRMQELQLEVNSYSYGNMLRTLVVVM